MNRRFVLALPATFFLAACGESPAPSAAPSLPSRFVLADPAQLGAHVQGFATGPLSPREAVYVFVDMQCPHCATLWTASKPLWQGERPLRFVWVPVAILNRASLAQGASILASQDPVSAMDAHKESLLARRGGMSADPSAAERFGTVVNRNGNVLRALGVQSVPHLVGRHAGSGQTVSHTGAMSTERLQGLLGV